MSNNSTLFTLLTALVLIAGCTTPAVQQEDPALNETNSGTLYVYRLANLTGAGEKYLVYCDDELVGTLGSGGTFIRRISVGQKTISIKRYSLGITTNSGQRIAFLVEAGNEYFIRSETTLGNIIPIGAAVVVSTNIGLALVSRDQWQADNKN